MTEQQIEFRVEQFKKFYDLLMQNAPVDYKPWFFPCEKNAKNPCSEAIKKLDKNNTKASWKHESARLNYGEVIEHIRQGYNIGISARTGDCLIIGDIDNPKNLNQMPKDTLTTTSRKRIGGHFFGLNKDNSAKINLPTEDGELRSNDQYVLCVGSYVPFDLESRKDKKAFEELSEEAKKDPLLGYYTIQTELPLRELEFGDLPEFFRDFYKKESKQQELITENESKKEYKEFKGEGKYSGLFQIKVSDIIGKIAPEKRFGHPLHESDTDANFSMSQDGTLGFCWRHLNSLNAVQFLCVKAGYRSCIDAGTPFAEWENGKKVRRRGYSKLKGDKKALEVAYHEAIKLGLIRKYKPSFEEATGIENTDLKTFIFDKNEVIQNKVFSSHLLSDSIFGFGLLLPRYEDKKDKNGKILYTYQTWGGVIITSERRGLVVSEELKKEHKIDFDCVPQEMKLRWELEDIRKYLDGKSEQVRGGELFDSIKAQYEHYNFYREKSWYAVNSLWDIGTYSHQLFSAYPLKENRGIAGTGKSKSMNVSSYITLNATDIMTNPSESTLFRETEILRPTKYIDEAEKLFKITKVGMEADNRVELINASYTRNGSVPRQEKLGRGYVTKWYHVYSPTQISSINGLYGATESRAITQIHTKSPDNDLRGERDPEDDINNPKWKAIRNNCYLWTLQNWEQIYNCYLNFDIKTTLKKRDLQLWKPLLVLAQIIDPDKLLPEILQFAERLANQRKDDYLSEGSLDYKLLSCVNELLREGTDDNKLFVNAIRERYNRNFKSNEPTDTNYNRTISNRLDKLGFKDLRYKDHRVGSYYLLTPQVFEEVVNPITSDFSSQSSQSSKDKGKDKKLEDEEGTKEDYNNIIINNNISEKAEQGDERDERDERDDRYQQEQFDNTKPEVEVIKI